MKRSILFLVSIWMTVAGFSQILPKKAYMRMQGYLNDQAEVLLNLVKVNDSLYADYILNAANVIPSPKVLGGRILADGSFTLKTPFDPEGTEINGRFITRQTITGTWQVSKGDPRYKFSFSENYPTGSVPLSVWFQSASKPLVGKGPVPRAFIEQCLVIPAESGNPVASDTVRKRIMGQLSTGEHAATDPQVLLNMLQQSYFSNYVNDNIELYKQMPDAGSLNWDLYKLVHVVYNDNFLLSYYLESYAFTGGAHGLGAQDYTVINMKTGKVVLPTDIFVKNYEPELTALLTKRLKKMENLQPGDKLSEKSEYFADEIPPNNNFYITGDGIGFFYNHYEIAPYSHGFTNIFLTFGELVPLLKSGSILTPVLR
jgi:hypothetical protein